MEFNEQETGVVPFADRLTGEGQVTVRPEGVALSPRATAPAKLKVLVVVRVNEYVPTLKLTGPMADIRKSPT